MRTLVLSLVAALALGTGVAVAQAGSTLAAAHAGASRAGTASADAAGVRAQPGVVIVAQASTPAPSPMPSPVSTIHIKNFAYNPASVTIPAGSTVRWVEDDEVPHTVTAADGSFDSGNLSQHQSWTHTFTTPGTYDYYCAYHTYMKGKIVIVP
ncbi:MAG TPA: cupredoxin family copper-binding protein [Candidatus Elarobacter sp.]|jgi:plastocyanin|nr:cupredoxin family copper-binding protein [Candidatus Elarobacter sp.]